ncbi:lysophospholipid acyltransferase family protein [Prosthecomicrobium sp. N25]|uniref:lysophospholipid acyltransferase family protein n=1 Tax=Prosthecomicrobium sp. N25 TaxID=3129254 RepID=UPI00307688BE
MTRPARAAGPPPPVVLEPAPGRPPLVGRLRGTLAVLWLALLTLAAVPLQALAVRRGWPLAATLPVWWHRRALSAVGARLTVHGAPCRDRPLLVTPNHVSWLDICLVGSLLPVAFVAKSEIAGWPLFGFLAKLQRSLFVDRSRRTDTARVSHEMAARMSAGIPVVLFPEGTSSDGVHVLPFRSALIGAARAAILKGGHERVWVQPLALAFTRRGGLPVGHAGRPRIGWYGDMDMVPHLLATLFGPPLDVELVWGEPIPFDETSDRKLLARALEREVRRLSAAARRGREPAPGGLPAAPAPTGVVPAGP